MHECKVTILLTERDVQRVEQAVVDRDGASALDLLIKVVQPQIDVALRAG